MDKSLIESIKELVIAVSKSPFWVVLVLWLTVILLMFRDDVSNFIANETMLEPAIIQQEIDKNIVVNGMLSKVMQETGACRAYVIFFHNGGHYISGARMVKISMHYEVIRAGIAPVAEKFQDVPTSLYTAHLDAIVEGHVLGVRSENLANTAASATLEQLGISHLAVLPVFDEEGFPVALVGVDWVNSAMIDFNENLFRRRVKAIGKVLFAGN